MNKVRRDVIRVELRQRRFRMAFCVLFLPEGYGLIKDSARKPQERRPSRDTKERSED